MSPFLLTGGFEWVEVAENDDRAEFIIRCSTVGGVLIRVSDIFSVLVSMLTRMAVFTVHSVHSEQHC